jgi:hypothetical protein
MVNLTKITTTTTTNNNKKKVNITKLDVDKYIVSNNNDRCSSLTTTPSSTSLHSSVCSSSNYSSSEASSLSSSSSTSFIAMNQIDNKSLISLQDNYSKLKFFNETTLIDLKLSSISSRFDGNFQLPSKVLP